MAALLALVGFGACFAEPNGKSPPMVASGSSSPVTDGGAGGIPAATGGAGGANPGPVCVARPAVKGAQCRPVTTQQPLRQRVVENIPVDTLYFTETLFGEFKSLCGSCHVASNLGGFNVTAVNFPTVVDEKVLAAMQSDTPTCELDGNGLKKDASCYDYMPPVGSPNGKTWSERKDKPNDPVTHLSGLIDQWIKAGRPADAFTVHDDSGGPYAIDADFAETFTNLGTCVPDAGMVATELDESCALDQRFAAMVKKPDSLLPEEQVGLPTTLDQTDLTTLDSAELAKHGVVAYQPAYPLWTDDAGKMRYVRVPQGQSITFNKKTKEFEIPSNTRFYKTFMKKVLTRDGVERYRKVETRVIVSRTGEESLYGTYLWNEAETQATLHTEPLNNGLPFKDKLLTLIKDEAAADQVKADWMAGKVRNYTKELDYQGLVRRYAVPSSERCVQCHMGGVGGSFILGFMPLDVNVRQCDQATLDAQGHCEGGIYEPFSDDELTQLERLISYGVISGYDKTNLISLEDPQGKEKREARSTEELTAQGYMLGNCSHCHNPNGYPSTLNPELKPLLNFRPNQDDGGIFQFPLDRYSPRITRENGSIKLPYITPSLRDIFSESTSWKPKRYKDLSSKKPEDFIDAPWRSLIYRNVDTPFTYGDDGAIFPHMPLNSPGFDCRAPRFLGEWMVNIPAVLKHPELTEDVVSVSQKVVAENDPQPYVEVKPTDSNYLNELANAQQRLATYKSGFRGDNYCPETKDIIDVWGVLYGPPTALVPEDGVVKGLPVENVPDRVHWVVTDVTDPPGEWNPRRTDWSTILVNQDFSSDEKSLEGLSGTILQIFTDTLNRQKQTVSILHDLTPSTKLLDYVKSKIPFGLWQKHDDCDFAKDGVKTVADIKPADRPRWMNWSLPPETEPVYETMPGAAVFSMICINCHGPDADSTGRQAVTLQELTGGTGRVANFRDGLFGPFGSGGANRKRVFGDDVTAMRYLPWMALGGTKTQIPPLILDLVAATPVLGAPRPEAPPVVNANMLETARALCRSVVTRGLNKPFQPQLYNKVDAAKDFQDKSGFLFDIGDAELWTKLCTIDNQAAVHKISVVTTGDGPALFSASTYYKPDKYPANTAVGNVVGAVEKSLTLDNDFPWCVEQPTGAVELAFLNTQKGSDGATLPICPAGFLDPANEWVDTTDAGTPELDHFATRGAINAGLAVFAYLDYMISQGKGRIPLYNECELLKPAATP